MIAKLICALFLLIGVSGCALLNPDPSGSDASAQAPKADAPKSPSSEKSAPAAVPPSPASPDAKRPGPVAQKPGAEEIREAQTTLKAAGFDPGPIDGKLGSRTRTAYQEFYSGCATIGELAAFSNGGPPQQPASAAEKQKPGAEQVRRAQEILQRSAFDPGLADGILGPQTEAAIEKYQAGCAALGGLLGHPGDPAVRQDAKTESRPTEAERPTAPAVSEAAPAAVPVKNDSGATAALVGENLSPEQIRLVQERLKSAGFYSGTIDGVMGPQTRAALRQQLRAKREY